LAKVAELVTPLTGQEVDMQVYSQQVFHLQMPSVLLAVVADHPRGSVHRQVERAVGQLVGLELLGAEQGVVVVLNQLRVQMVLDLERRVDNC
jgi:hypothetical protein